MARSAVCIVSASQWYVPARREKVQNWCCEIKKDDIPFWKCHLLQAVLQVIAFFQAAPAARLKMDAP
ncbi:MAG TPA: hypothetical protein PLI75_19220, partial [Anaerolineales bacterium]|nr:hypothetical protein [Anaerolineales bacterium]